jgi:hypothetical protein
MAGTIILYEVFKTRMLMSFRFCSSSFPSRYTKPTSSLPPSQCAVEVLTVEVRPSEIP